MKPLFLKKVSKKNETTFLKKVSKKMKQLF
jgi:hypothetical protein